MSSIQPQLSADSTLEAAASALAIVSQELMETIRAAHLALEDCVEGRGGTEALVRCGQHLHHARGALRLTETYGAALLAEEMELVCGYLAGLRPGKGREDGLDALTRSMVQLPVYIERLLGGGRDIALVLLPILNDLRAARGQPLLSESTLLLLNLSPSRRSDGKAPRDGGGENPVSVAMRLRPKFQLALPGWIQVDDATRHLETRSAVAGLQGSPRWRRGKSRFRRDAAPVEVPACAPWLDTGRRCKAPSRDAFGGGGSARAGLDARRHAPAVVGGGCGPRIAAKRRAGDF